jgi:polyisoprenoid-binding protein YceI
MRALMRAAVACAALLLAACQTVPTTPGGASTKPAGATAAAVPAAATAGATLLHIDAAASGIEFRVRAAGPLAPLGHAHVLQATGFTGELWLDTDLAHARLQLRLPVESMIVDDPRARAAAGGDFAKPLPEEARRGTREHLLGERQLDATHFPRILLESTALTVLKGDVAAGEGTLALQATVRGRTTTLPVPVAWEQRDGTLRARGQFTLSQAALGIEPYSVGGGALRVADDIEARFELVAR